jgi:putative heme degradation protein
MFEFAFPKEAEAMPVGTIVKRATKATLGAASSAAKALRGMTLQGKVVKDVRKGRGVWRSILFEDGTQMTVEKRYVNDLCRARGTQAKMEEFGAKRGDAQTVQALRSLRYHEARVQPFFTRDTTRKLTKEHQTRLSQIDEAIDRDSAYVLYQGKYFAMPKEYATHLEGMGILKIMRGTRETRALTKTKGKKTK